MSRSTIAVVIPTKNVANFFRPTLESLTWCDEVIVVDMNSTDGTVEMAKEFPNVKYFARESYIYNNVNYGIEQSTTDWVMRLDSDEIVTPELKKEIEDKVLNNPDVSYDGFDAQSEVYFLGYKLTHGFGNNNWRATLFKKGKAHYIAQSEHEDMVKKGHWGRLENRYLHFTNETISMWWGKINYYTDKDVARWDPATPRPQCPSLPKMFYMALRWWQRHYLWPHKAYKDGVPGLIVSTIAAVGLLIEYFKMWEKNERFKKGPEAFPNHPNARPELFKENQED